MDSPKYACPRPVGVQKVENLFDKLLRYVAYLEILQREVDTLRSQVLKVKMEHRGEANQVLMLNSTLSDLVASRTEYEARVSRLVDSVDELLMDNRR